MIASTCSEVNVIIVPLEAAIIQFYLDAVQQFLLDFFGMFFFLNTVLHSVLQQWAECCPYKGLYEHF